MNEPIKVGATEEEAKAVARRLLLRAESRAEMVAGFVRAIAEADRPEESLANAQKAWGGVAKLYGEWRDLIRALTLAAAHDLLPRVRERWPEGSAEIEELTPGMIVVVLTINKRIWTTDPGGVPGWETWVTPTRLAIHPGEDLEEFAALIAEKHGVADGKADGQGPF